MTRITMPDPVAWATSDLSKFFGENEMQTLEHLGGSREKQKTFLSIPLITTDQAEAYANAKVKQALEDAANRVADPLNIEASIENFSWGSHDNYVRAHLILRDAVEAIRALIPKEDE